MYDSDNRPELAHLPVNYAGLALPSTVTSATLFHQASKDVCSHFISALKDETTFETAKHSQTMAAATAAIRTSRDSLHEHELKSITEAILSATKRTNLRSQETGKMHCIFDIVEHHPISPLILTVVELNSP